jgi:glutathione peroxidase
MTMPLLTVHRKGEFGGATALRVLGLVVALAAAPAALAQDAVKPPLHQIEVATMDGGQKRLGEYAGKVLLLVNVASECGLTPQYAGLQKLYAARAAEGLELLAFPCNDFGAQEPGSHEEIQKFCKDRYDVSFPLFAKVAVKGEQTSALYKYLTEQSPVAGPVRWNFQKYLVGHDGAVLAAFDPRMAPDDPRFVAAVDAALAQKNGKLEAEKVSAGFAAAAYWKAQQKAAQEKKKLLVDFSADWCGWCKRFEAWTQRPVVKPLFEREFVMVTLVTDHSPDGQAWLDAANKGKGGGIPFLQWLDERGRVVADSFDGGAENFGCPWSDEERSRFFAVLKKVARFSEAELTLLADDLLAFKTETESKAPKK